MVDIKFISMLALLTLIINSPVSAQSYDLQLYSYDLSKQNLDGTIDSEEYATSFDVMTTSDEVFMTVAWGHDETHVAVAMTGKFTGYVAIGMNEPGMGMTGADMIIISVEGNSVLAQDYHSTGNVAPTIDENQMNISVAGKEESGQTTVEILFPLTSDDEDGKDHQWVEGETYAVFFAAHQSSDSLTYHTWHSPVWDVNIADSSVELPENRVVTPGANSNGGENSFAAVGTMIGVLVFFGVVVSYNTKRK